MTNTMNTPVEALEFAFPLRLRRYALRRGSGGDGLYKGGDGLIRDVEFLSPARVTVLSERRRYAPPGYHGGHHGEHGENVLLKGGYEEVHLAGKENSGRGGRRHLEHSHTRRRRLGRSRPRPPPLICMDIQDKPG